MNEKRLAKKVAVNDEQHRRFISENYVANKSKESKTSKWSFNHSAMKGWRYLDHKGKLQKYDTSITLKSIFFGVK